MRNTRYELVMSIVCHERTRSYARDGVHERNGDFDRFSDQVFYFTEHGEVVLGLDVFWIGGIQASHEPTKRCDSDTLANTKHCYIWSQLGGAVITEM